MKSSNDRLFSPSVARNQEFITDTYRIHMPSVGTVLEIASGTGEHAVHIAKAHPKVQWRPGDPDQMSRKSIAAWANETGLENIAAPHSIDARASVWKDVAPNSLDGIVSINMIHIAPCEAMEGLINGAGTYLKPSGKLFLYGPFSRNRKHSAPSNVAFDQSLKSRNPEWGVRDLEEDVVPLASQAGLTLEVIVDMPANNLSVIFRKGEGP